MATPKLSNKKLKYIRRHGENDSPQEIADALRIPVSQVEEVLREEGYLKPTIGAAGSSIGWLPLFFTMFLAVAPFIISSKLAESTKTPQNAYIQIGTVIFALVLLHLRGPRQTLQLGWKPLGILAIAFLGWCTISFAWAQSIRDGIERILTYGGIALLYLVTLNIVRRDFLPRLLETLLGAGWVVALIGWGQYMLGWDFFQQTAQPAATFVNKNMACHFMVLTIPLGFYMFMRYRKLWQQAMVGICAATMLGYVFHTQTKGAWLALAVEILVLGVLVVVQAIRQRRATPATETTAGESAPSTAVRLRLGLPQLGLIASSMVVLFVLTSLTSHVERQSGRAAGQPAVALFDWQQLPAALGTVQATVSEHEEFMSGTPETAPKDSIAKQVERGEKSMETSSLAVRLIVWKNTLRMWQDHLLFGVGMGNFRANYDLYARSAVVDTFWPANEWHRVHNDYLQVAVETGLVGLLLLLGLLGCLLWLIGRALLDPWNPAPIALAVCLAGLSISSFFSFPFERTIPPMLLAVYAALITILARERARLSDVKLAEPSFRGALAASYVLVALLAWSHLKLIRSDYYYRKVLNAEANNRFQDVVDYGNRLMAVDPHRVRILCRMGRAYTDLNQPLKSIEVLQDSVDVFPTWYLGLHNLAVAYQRSRNPERSYHYAERALALYPVASETFNVMGCAKLDEANIIKQSLPENSSAADKADNQERVMSVYREAEAYFQKAMELDDEHHEYAYNKGLAKYWQGELKDAMTLMHLSIELKPDYAMPYKDLGAMYASDLRDLDKAAEMFQKALELDPRIEGAGQLVNFLQQQGKAVPGQQAQPRRQPAQPRLPTGP